MRIYLGRDDGGIGLLLQRTAQPLTKPFKNIAYIHENVISVKKQRHQERKEVPEVEKSQVKKFSKRSCHAKTVW